jgi:hypothetical protein
MSEGLEALPRTAPDFTMCRLGVAIFAVALVPSMVCADSFTIQLVARTAKEAKSVEAAFPVAKPQPRAVLEVAAGTPVTAKWVSRNVGSAEVKDVLIHFFVVKEDKPDQQEVPKLTKNVVVESALTMDFRVKDRTEGEITFTVRNPGVYLMRVELKGAAGKGEPEPFAALDLVVR